MADSERLQVVSAYLQMLRNIERPKFFVMKKNGDSFEKLQEVETLKDITISSEKLDDSEIIDTPFKPIEMELEINLTRAQRRRIVRKLKKEEKRIFKKQEMLF